MFSVSGGDVKAFRQNRSFNVTLKTNLELLTFIRNQVDFNTFENYKQSYEKAVQKHDGDGLVQFAHLGAKGVVTTNFEHDWLQGGLKKLPRGYWKQEKNRRSFMDLLGKQLGFKTMEDWYKITQKDIIEYGGSQLLDQYSCSPSKIVQDVYSEHTWLCWKFEIVPKGFWSDKKNQRDFMDSLGKQLGFQTMEDWYRISLKILQDRGGNGLLIHYRYSPIKLFQEVYSEHLWLIWKFEKVPKGYWDDKKNQRDFMDDLGKHLGFTTKENWYLLNMDQVEAHGGGGLIKLYHGSPAQLVQGVYPERPWLIWRFQKIPKEYREGMRNLEEERFKLAENMRKELQIEDLSDWYRVSNRQLIPFGRWRDFHKMLPMIYPEHKWDIEKLERRGIMKASQRELELSVKKLFPNRGKYIKLKD